MNANQSAPTAELPGRPLVAGSPETLDAGTSTCCNCGDVAGKHPATCPHCGRPLCEPCDCLSDHQNICRRGACRLEQKETP